jgi:hypothetical protein
VIATSVGSHQDPDLNQGGMGSFAKLSSSRHYLKLLDQCPGIDDISIAFCAFPNSEVRSLNSQTDREDNIRFILLKKRWDDIIQVLI